MYDCIYIGVSELSLQRQKEISNMERETLKILEKKAMEKCMRNKKLKDEKRFKWLLNDVDHSKGYLDTVDKSLELFHETSRNKKRHQFEDWNANVHGKF